MATTRSAIPTTYRHNAFRSRLEARWARFFDLVGWSWVYEPFDTGNWIPDFLIQGPRPLLVEVGPCVTWAEYEAKAEKPRAHLDHPTLVVGVSPQPFSHLRAVGADYIGLLTNEFGDGASWPAYWLRCGTGVLSVFGDDKPFPCGHDGGDQGRLPDLESLWAQAGAAVQWRP
jgi:hypothetical protein